MILMMKMTSNGSMIIHLPTSLTGIRVNLIILVMGKTVLQSLGFSCTCTVNYILPAVNRPKITSSLFEMKLELLLESDHCHRINDIVKWYSGSCKQTFIFLLMLILSVKKLCSSASSIFTKNPPRLLHRLTASYQETISELNL